MDTDWSKSQINADQCQWLKDLVSKFSNFFVDQNTKLFGLTDMATCRIDTAPVTKPIHKYLYCLDPMPVRK